MLPLKSLVRGIQEPCKAIQAEAVVLSYPIVFDDKAPLLHIPHTLVTGHGRLNLVWPWKLPHC